jgi:hypothetical protein
MCKGKAMLEVYLILGVLSTREGCTVQKVMFVEILSLFRDAVRKKHPGKWEQNSWFLLHENAATNRSLVVKEFLAKAQCDDSGISAMFSGPVSDRLFLVSGAKNCSKRTIRFPNTDYVTARETKPLT